MILRIDDNKSVADLQEKFELCFPGLKIEFYRKPHNWYEATASKYLLSSESLIGNIRKVHDRGELEIKSWFQAGRVEQDFKDHFGLNVQVFRYCQNRWVQTIFSDKLTLAQLSQKTVEIKVRSYNTQRLRI